jgi:hypothetical protein
MLFGTGLGKVLPGGSHRPHRSRSDIARCAGPGHFFRIWRPRFQVTYAGLVPAVGLYQLNIVLPEIPLYPGETFDDHIGVYIYINGERIPGPSLYISCVFRAMPISIPRRWRSRFRTDADRDSEMMAITIPTGCRSLFGGFRNGDRHRRNHFLNRLNVRRAAQRSGQNWSRQTYCQTAGESLFLTT